MNHDFDAQDSLWRVLGHARTTEVRPMFTADVMRRIRLESTEVDTKWSWIKVLAPSGVVAALAVVLSFFLWSPSPAPIDTAFVEAADMETLVASGADWAWQEVAP